MIVGIEIDGGLLVDSPIVAGEQVSHINRLAASRYRARHTASGAKLDAGDAQRLGDLVGTELALTDELAILIVAPPPERARGLSRAKIAAGLRCAGRHGNLAQRAIDIQTELRTKQAAAPSQIRDAIGAASVTRVTGLNQQIAVLERAQGEYSHRQPDAGILCRLSGLGLVPGACVLAEFGDDSNRFGNVRGRNADVGTAPIIGSSGRSLGVFARSAPNRRLIDAGEHWAFCSLTANPGARRSDDALWARGETYSQVTRQLANRWVGMRASARISPGWNARSRCVWRLGSWSRGMSSPRAVSGLNPTIGPVGTAAGATTSGFSASYALT